MLPSWKWCCKGLVRTGILKVHIALIFRVGRIHNQGTLGVGQQTKPLYHNSNYMRTEGKRMGYIRDELKWLGGGLLERNHKKVRTRG
jgi:hypothetical protein